MHHEDRPYTTFEAGAKLNQYTRLPFGVTNGVSFFQRFIDYLIEKYCLCGTYAYLDNITVRGNNTADHDDKHKGLLNAAKREGLTFNDNKCIYNQTEINLLGYRVFKALISALKQLICFNRSTTLNLQIAFRFVTFTVFTTCAFTDKTKFGDLLAGLLKYRVAKPSFAINV